METISPKIFTRNDLSYLKVDMGSYYYEGIINRDYFPSNISDVNAVVQKAIDNYTTSTNTISGNFVKPCQFDNDTIYKITITVNSEFYSDEKTIEIPMRFNQKEQIDYINEKFDQFQLQIQSLKKENDELRKSLDEINDYLDEEYEKSQKDKVVDSATKSKRKSK